MVHVHEFTKEKAPTNLCLWRPLSSLDKNDVSFQTAICIVLLLKKVNCVNRCSFEALMFSKIVSYVTLYDNVGDCHFHKCTLIHVWHFKNNNKKYCLPCSP